MPPDRSQNHKGLRGAIILLIVIALATLTFFIQDIFRATEHSIHVIGLIPDATSVDAKTPVWVAGRTVGAVTAVRFRGVQSDSTERLAVVMEIPRKYAVQIRRDATIRVTTERLIGDPVIDIDPGSPNAPAIADHDTLRMSPTGSLEGVMDKALALETDFDKLIVDMHSFQRGAKRGSDQLARLQSNMTALSVQFRDFSAGMAHSPMRILSDGSFSARLNAMQQQNAELGVALRKAMQRAQGAGGDLQASLKQLMARSDSISKSIATLRSTINQNGGGLLMRARSDSAIVKALHEASVQLDSLMAATKRNPLRFWF